MLASKIASVETHHGVLMRVDNTGVLITGKAGSGKSSLALALLHQNHQLIADDIIEFQQHAQRIIGQSPPLLKGLLHQREIGLLNVSKLFGLSAILEQSVLDVVIHLDSEFQAPVDLKAPTTHYHVLGQDFPQLTLNPHNPAQLSLRLTTWLAIRNQHAAKLFSQQQQSAMSAQKT